MARVKAPLQSVRASGRFGNALRYSHSVNRDVVKRNKTGGATAGLPQQRQASIISEGGRLWKTRTGRGPEATYRAYVAGISANSWFL